MSKSIWFKLLYIQEYASNLTNGTFTLRQWAPRGVNPLPARYITATIAGWCGNQGDFDPDYTG